MWCKKKKLAHSKNIISWKDKNCTAKKLEFKSGITADTLNQILSINRQNKDNIRINSLLEDKTWRKCTSNQKSFY